MEELNDIQMRELRKKNEDLERQLTEKEIDYERLQKASRKLCNAWFELAWEYRPEELTDYVLELANLIE